MICFALAENKVSLIDGSVENLLLRARESSSPKVRLMALHWGLSVFGWSSFVIKTVIALAGAPGFSYICDLHYS